MIQRGSGGILQSARALLAGESRLVLAVSGGVDSMTLLDAVARVKTPAHEIVVATFDHGTGDAAREAAALTGAEAARRGLRVRSHRAALANGGEAEWRNARWSFLRRVAAAERSPVVTAHTRDDQIETVVMRLLRGCGSRGLAGMYAPSAIRRPLLEQSRAAIRRYARSRQVRFVEDPTNASRVFLRNRVRLDLLPALLRARPAFEEEILSLARRAASLRCDFDALVEHFIVSRSPAASVDVAATPLSGCEPAALAYVWQAIAGAGGIVLDRRGLNRLSGFTKRAHPGKRIQLSGGLEVLRSSETFTLRRRREIEPMGTESLPRSGSMQFGPWRFRCLSDAGMQGASGDPWIAALPSNAELLVRAWQDGDRMIGEREGHGRRVKRFFADARIAGPNRVGWPVVLVDGKVVWIPGVRRSLAAIPRHEESSALYVCERQTG